MPRFLTLLVLLFALAANAAEPPGREAELIVAQGEKSIAGKTVPCLTLNGGFPGPVLRFREGDTVRITVRNRLPKESTSIHWHGLLVPNLQDGVPEMTTPLIPAGGSHVFELPLKQAGTYWYHSHTALQEQEGIYGAIVIEPKGPEAEPPDRDYVVLLSDWTHESGAEVMRTLMRGDEWYLIKKQAMPSLLGAWRADALADYFDREKQSMPPMDLSDVAYDAFLVNGQEVQRLAAKPGERIRLRLINAASATYFHVDSATGPLTLTAADGLPVTPVAVPRLFHAIAETYDAEITIPAGPERSWVVRASAIDGSGRAELILGSGPRQELPPLDKPDIYRMEAMLDAALAEADTPLTDGSPGSRALAPYPLLRAPQKTSLPADAPVREITLRLSGDMTRYVWSFNGKTLAEDGVIPVKKGEVLRLVMINDTMMHHPLHLHGHYFRLINGQGDFAPLKHTLDLPPMGRRTVEFLADENGDWFFHCHVLYHMMMGMARVFSTRDTLEEVRQVEYGEADDDLWYGAGKLTLASNEQRGELMAMDSKQRIELMWESSWQAREDLMAELSWARYLGSDDAFVSGLRHERMTMKMFHPVKHQHHGAPALHPMEVEHEDEQTRAFLGLEHRFPFFLHSRLSLDHTGELRLEVDKSFQLSNSLSFEIGAEYDTEMHFSHEEALVWRFSKPLSLRAGYHSERHFGLGLTYTF
ncbi:MAG: hypothetical protein RL095_1426 [Verrucomicrobiota bacterium]|jgi:FtsP/CotA-like multicopper oxidase with cupredoxin domain